MRVQREMSAICLFLWAGGAVPCDAAVSGRVVGPDGRPISGARVGAFALETSVERSARLVAGRPRVPIATALTSADGSFGLPSTHPVVDVEARATGFAPEVARLADTEDRTLMLQKAASVRGRVLSRGQPVAGASVFWLLGTDASDLHDVVERSGPDGTYEVPAPEAWASGVVVTHPDFAPSSSSSQAAGWGTTPRHELERGVPIKGRVVDRATGRGVVGAELWVDGWPLGRSAADGSFLVPRAPRGWSALTARTDALAGTASPSAGQVVVRLDPLRRLSGVVRDRRSRPLAGAVVSLGGGAIGYTATSDAAGRYALAVPEGRYFAAVGRPGFAPLVEAGDEATAIDLRRDRAAERDFTLTGERRLAGRVQDEARRPVGGARVRLASRKLPRLYSLRDLDPSVASSAWSGPDGRFSIALPADEAAEAPSEWTALGLKPGYAMGVVDGVSASSAASPLEITLASGVELTGRVTGPDGAPLEGVAVEVAESEGFTGLLRAAAASLGGDGWTRTGANGLFSTRVRTGPHELLFQASGRAPRAVRGHTPSSGAPLEVVLDAASEIRGKVVRADGAAAPGLQLFAWMSFMERPAFTVTAEDGGFALSELVPGSYQVQLLKDGQPLGEARSVEAPTSELRIELEPVGRIEGRVTEARTRQPVARFELAVEYAADGSDYDTPRFSFPADDTLESGRFTLDSLRVGEATLVVRAPGFVARRLEGIVVTAEAELPLLEVALEPATLLRGRVTSEDAEPLPDVIVTAEGDDELGAFATTDGRGEYELEGLPAGPVELSFSLSGYRSAKRSVEVAEGARLDVALSRGVALTGVVLADGKGVPKAFVTAQSSVAGAEPGQAVTDRGGRFTISGLSAGRYAISARGPEGEEAEVKDVDVERSGPLRLVLERARTAVLYGRVVGLTGSSEQMVYVMAQGENGSGRAQVDASGAFRMEKVPAGVVKVSAMSFAPDGSGRTSRVNTVELAPGSESETLVEFSEGVVVSGTVSRDGMPAAGASVSFRSHEGSSARARADAAGRYEVVGLEPGLYRVEVSGLDLSYDAEHTLVDSMQLDLDATGVSLAGSVTDTGSGEPIASAEVSLWRVDDRETRPSSTVQTSANGTFSARALREGAYRVLASKDGFGQEVRELDLRRGAPGEVTFGLTPAEGLTVEVVDGRDGRSLEAVVVVRDRARNVIANRHSGVGADGTLTIPLAPGQYLLSTSASGYGTATLPVTAPGRGLRVPLTPGGTLVVLSPRELRGRLRLFQPDGEEYVRCWCNGIAGIDLEGRRTTAANVTPGSYRVEVLDAGGHPVPAPASVVIQEGGVSSLTVE